MSHTANAIDAAIAADRFADAADALNGLSELGGLDAGDEIALALLLMSPPLAAWDESLDHLRKAMADAAHFEAAAWGAYISEEFYPVTDQFHAALLEHSDRADACFLLCEQARTPGTAMVPGSGSRAVTRLTGFRIRFTSNGCTPQTGQNHMLSSARRWPRSLTIRPNFVPRQRDEVTSANDPGTN